MTVMLKHASAIDLRGSACEQHVATASRLLQPCSQHVAGNKIFIYDRGSCAMWPESEHHRPGQPPSHQITLNTKTHTCAHSISRSCFSFVVLQELLRLGVPVDAKNAKGLTAYEIATRINRQCESVGEPGDPSVHQLPSIFFTPGFSALYYRLRGCRPAS